MQILPTGLPGVFLLQPEHKADKRGVFCELWTATTLKAAGLEASFVQMNCSRSRCGALRGLHYQAAPHGQGKLVTVTAGRIFDVVVDLHRSSPSYGKWQGRYLDNVSCEQLYIPDGLAHGFLAVTDNTTVCYACTTPYNPQPTAPCAGTTPTLPSTGLSKSASSPSFPRKTPAPPPSPNVRNMRSADGIAGASPSGFSGYSSRPGARRPVRCNPLRRPPAPFFHLKIVRPWVLFRHLATLCTA
jgi:dTDP-4-dehydrorhamnose 3,5-epimerase